MKSRECKGTTSAHNNSATRREQVVRGSVLPPPRGESKTLGRGGRVHPPGPAGDSNGYQIVQSRVKVVLGLKRHITVLLLLPTQCPLFLVLWWLEAAAVLSVPKIRDK
ncbi:hypothetical protein E2C01_061595 [Portunus trituberculatus]|uniref:Uncharacterized protein n=1 Tax=Portunus trituberculatus TaxID=210409 RepID=A0A5B7H5N3_PORTR|nr:hypothetical protein [Portunus trituberculatus]